MATPTPDAGSILATLDAQQLAALLRSSIPTHPGAPTLLDALGGVPVPLGDHPDSKTWFAPKQDNYHDFMTGIVIHHVASEADAAAMIKHFAPMMKAAHAASKQVGITLDTETTASPSLRARFEAATSWMSGLTEAISNIKKTDDGFAAAKEKHDEARTRYNALSKEYQKAGLRVHSGEVRLVQIYHRGDPMVWVIDRWAVSASLWQALATFLGRPEFVWICHNAFFDATMLAAHGCTPAHPPHCTLLQATALAPTKSTRKTLAARCAEMLGKTPAKELQASDWGNPNLTEAQLRYAASDVVATSELFMAQHLEIVGRCQSPRLSRAAGNFTDENPMATYELMRGSIPAVVEVRVTGLPFNREAHKPMAEQMGKDAERLRAECVAAFEAVRLQGYAIPPVENPGSSTQIAEWLRVALQNSAGAHNVFNTGAQGWPKTATGVHSTDKDVIAANINSLADLYQTPIRALLAWKKVETANTALGEGFAKHVNQTTGNIHANFRIGTETLRFSVADPALQTINRESNFRELFEALPGKKFVIADYGQIQVRLAGVLSCDKVMLDTIQEGADIHTFVAMPSFEGQWEVAFEQWWAEKLAGRQFPTEAYKNRDYLMLSKDPGVGEFFKKGPMPYMRQGTKITVFANQFGAQPPTILQQWLAQGVEHATLADAARVQTMIFTLFPDFAGWMTDVREESMGPDRDSRQFGDKGTGLLWTPMGNVYEPENPRQLFTKSVNTPIQGAEAEIVLRALRCFPRAWGTDPATRLNASLCHLVHDEFVAIASDEHAQATADVLVKAMTWAALKTFPTMPTTKLVDVSIGQSWGAK